MALVVLLMIIARDRLRDAYLQPWFHPHQFTEKTQWSTMPLFLAYLLRRRAAGS